MPKLKTAIPMLAYIVGYAGVLPDLYNTVYLWAMVMAGCMEEKTTVLPK